MRVHNIDVAGNAHRTVRLAVADAPGGARWWQVGAEHQHPATTVIGDAIAALPSQASFAELRSDVAALLGLDAADKPIVSPASDGQCESRSNNPSLKRPICSVALPEQNCGR